MAVGCRCTWRAPRGLAFMEFTDFHQLDDKDKFIAIVTTHMETSFSKLTNQVQCQPFVDPALVALAYETYSLSLDQFALLLASKNPDQYKRSGALLHALYKSRPLSGVSFANGYSEDDLESGVLLGVSYDDAQHMLAFARELSDVGNEIMSFDLAFRCCQVYEPEVKTYDLNFMDLMIYYMHENSSLSVASFAMIFKAFMA